jgi:L-threonylcarbamoyladenylate synthase
MSVARAAEVIRAGGLVAFPTETVYGLGCDAANPRAVAKLYAVKGRPQLNPLIVHVLGVEDALRHGALPDSALKLAAAFWPGPLTLVAQRKDESSVAELACAGLNTIALRAPAHPMARALLQAASVPVAAPSANRSGRLSPTTAAHVREEFGDAIDLILDGGRCAHGLESTIIGFDAEGRARLLRPGAIEREAIEVAIGPLQAPGDGVAAPGMLASHYAPNARLRLDAEAPEPGEVYLSFGAPAPPGGATLSARGDLVEAAANLYGALRELDARGPSIIAVAPIPKRGLGEAINDRLARAAAPREGR